MTTSCLLRSGQVPYHGQILDPGVRSVPDNICKQLGLSIGTLIKIKSHPFFDDKKYDKLVPKQFWDMTKTPQFNGLTGSDIDAILNSRSSTHYYKTLFNHLDKNEEPWKHLRNLFVQSYLDNVDDTSPSKTYTVIMQYLENEMTKCLNTFYNLCDERELPSVQPTDIGHVEGYTYIVVADASDHDRPDENTVCVTTDLSHAQHVVDYLCTVVSLLKRGVDVELSKDISMFIDKDVWDVRIHRIPIVTNACHNC